MIIELSLKENYTFHLNNAIKLLNSAINDNKLDDYIVGFLSAALVLELGLKLAVRETINGDIFMRENDGEIKLSKNYKREMTLSSSVISKIIKENHSKFEGKILNIFSGVKIDSTIIDDEIDFISEIRNSLFHYQGDFDTRIIVDILKAFVFINILLPVELSMINILTQKEDFVALLKAFPLQFTGIFSNVNEIMIHKDNYFDINIGSEDLCSECGYEALVSLESDKGHCYLCLLCSHHDYFLQCFDCGIELPKECMAYSDKETDIFLCEACYDRKFH